MAHQGGAEERIQTVRFLRHGVAKHNVPDPVTGQPPNIHSPALWDPSLIDRGQHQAVTVGRRLAHVLPGVELIVASPLSRCMETAQLVFGTCHNFDRTGATPPPLVCVEQVREAYGMHYPDKRRDKSFLQQQFPMVRFDPAMTEKDERWSETSRETLDQVVARVQDFFRWVVQRPENNVFVVSHGVWIECCLNAFFPLMLQGGARVYNCDCFEAEIVSKNGAFVRMQNVGKI